MIALVGIKKHTEIDIRERFTIREANKEIIHKRLLSKFKEIIILNTCNRTEIYLNYISTDVNIIKEVMSILDWDAELLPFTFIIEGSAVYKHLFEVVCGYHSKIIGEDQILGQIKEAYSSYLKVNKDRGELLRLFQMSITCGKEFRKTSSLYQIPVSSTSIAVNKIVKEDFKRIMVIGYGEVGSKTIKSLISHKRENIYLVVRNPDKIDDLEKTGVNIINFHDKNKYINEMDCIISCTSAPHVVVIRDDITEKGQPLVIFDLAIPRDVEQDIALLKKVKLYNIDHISKIDDNNKNLRIERMNSHRYIINKYILEFQECLKLMHLSPVIKELKDRGTEIYTKRALTFKHKIKDKQAVETMEILLKSTSDAYVNRAIEVLKEEELEGGVEEVLKVVKRIFNI